MINDCKIINKNSPNKKLGLDLLFKTLKITRANSKQTKIQTENWE